MEGGSRGPALPILPGTSKVCDTHRHSRDGSKKRRDLTKPLASEMGNQDSVSPTGYHNDDDSTAKVSLPSTNRTMFKLQFCLSTTCCLIAHSKPVVMELDYQFQDKGACELNPLGAS